MGGLRKGSGGRVEEGWRREKGRNGLVEGRQGGGRGDASNTAVSRRGQVLKIASGHTRKGLITDLTKSNNQCCTVQNTILIEIACWLEKSTEEILLFSKSNQCLTFQNLLSLGKSTVLGLSHTSNKIFYKFFLTMELYYISTKICVHENRTEQHELW